MHNGYKSAGLTQCNTLYSAAGSVTPPVFTYKHPDHVVPGETCSTGSSSISGLAFYGGGTYPTTYNGALFFADYSRDCIWAMLPGSNGQPDPTRIQTFVQGASGPVNLTIGPGGDLFYVGFNDGTIRRVTYSAGNQPPIAVIGATSTVGPAPLAVNFDGTRSSDPESEPLSYTWDLDGDGSYGDSTSPTPSHTYSDAGNYVVRLRVADPQGATAADSVQVTVNSSQPTPIITMPTSAATWAVGDVISFAGSATDEEDGELPSSALTWTLVLRHCPSNCHSHEIRSWDGVASGSFSAPDHGYPSHLQLQLTATDSSGLRATTSVRLNPSTVKLTMQTRFVDLNLNVDGRVRRAPFTVTVIQGHNTSLIAPTPQWRFGKRYVFVSWSDGGARAHNVTAGAPATYTAKYVQRAG